MLLFALAIAVVSLADALQTEAREGVAAAGGLEGDERFVLDRADVVVAPDGGAPVAPEAAFGGAAGPVAAPGGPVHRLRLPLAVPAACAAHLLTARRCGARHVCPARVS